MQKNKEIITSYRPKINKEMFSTSSRCSSRKSIKNKSIKTSKLSQKYLIDLKSYKYSLNTKFNDMTNLLKTERKFFNINKEQTFNFLMNSSKLNLETKTNKSNDNYLQSSNSFNPHNHNSNHSHIEKNSLTVNSRTTKENTILENSASPKKNLRSSFYLFLNSNNIEGPEELHFFNNLTSHNNKNLAYRFDKNQADSCFGIYDEL